MDPTHWEHIYTEKTESQRSWFEPEPALSLDYVIQAADGRKDACVLDVGAGTSRLVDRLLEQGFACLGVLDIAQTPLDATATRLGARAGSVRFVKADITQLDEISGYEIWHDRAVLHFLTQEWEVERYANTVTRSIPPGGHAVIATFGPDGPRTCSGLPVKRYSVDRLADLLHPAFDLRASRLATHVKPMGGTQQFLYCLFDRS